MCARSFFAPEEYYTYSAGAQRSYIISNTSNVYENERIEYSALANTQVGNGNKEVSNMTNSPSIVML